MLLRTSSAPVLGSLSSSQFPPAEAFRESMEPPHHVLSSNFSSYHSLAPPFVHTRRASCDGHGICAADDTSEHELDRISRPRHLSRAQSEGDLACVSAAMGAVAPEDQGFSGSSFVSSRRVYGVPSHSVIIPVDVTESILEESDEVEQLTQPSSPRSLLHAAFLDPDIARGLMLNDGELYSSVTVGPSGSPLACNDKGCRPLTDSECKQLGFLDMASGIGSHVWNEPDEAAAVSEFPNSREIYYQRLLQQDPNNPLLLRNYAVFLSKRGDIKKSEEYYERAISEDPNDGEVLLQYAKLQWDVHRDQERAETYYDQAVQAAPDDCYVMASYASFLWDVEDSKEASASPTAPACSASSLLSRPLLAAA